ncbi:testis-specific serine/threonine-protein kinase 1 [Aethina tumida]|uniref:testis-specific serine/threonine-protein kinase 1 n=1 Tax=Aethina tumida TaxID=116153 RepID=UPI00096B3180|nr:testis-specific serine/threonine-protein kinase 1 [Aethina tumida]
MAKDLFNTPSEELTLSQRGYKILKNLGEGSYAKVYLAEYTETKADKADNKTRVLACKVIDTLKAPKDFVKKFLPRELDITIRLNHPHIVHVHSVFQRKAKYFIFMRFAENGDVLEYILKKGTVSEPQARVWFRQLSLAMQYLHNLDIAHRDLKCENCLITGNFNLKLADFGFARFTSDKNGKLILSSTYCGSLSYAPPEILKGSPYYPKIGDLWSMGIILYVMLNKAMPFDDSNIKKLYEQQLSKKWAFRSKVVDGLSDQVKEFIPHLLEPNTKTRYTIEDVLTSQWISMDPRLAALSPAEEQALKASKEGRKTFDLSKPVESKGDNLLILKPNDHRESL